MSSQLFANVTWPALIFYQRGMAWWIIAVSIIVEWWIIRRALKTTAARAFAMAFAMNLFSALLGWLSGLVSWPSSGKMPLLPLSGLVWLLYVDHWGSAWSVAVASSAAINTVIEGFFLLLVFRRLLMKSIILWLPIANVVTAEITFLTFYATPAISAPILVVLVVLACVSLAFKKRNRPIAATVGPIPQHVQDEVMRVEKNSNALPLAECADQLN
jgi:hypothetical protein